VYLRSSEFYTVFYVQYFKRRVVATSSHIRTLCCLSKYHCSFPSFVVKNLVFNRDMILSLQPKPLDTSTADCPFFVERIGMSRYRAAEILRDVMKFSYSSRIWGSKTGVA
jgi:hypothetical protein